MDSTITTTFRELGLQEDLLEQLARQGFEVPTPVQTEAIPSVLAGRDLLASAQTGSGKTAAFSLPIIQLLSSERGRPEPHRPRALILAPTRELAGQIGDVIKIFTKGGRISSTVIYGGVGKHQQIHALRRGIDIAIATPGRLLDLMGEGAVSLDHVKIIVLDEADRMLDMGFIPDVERIIKRLPAVRQSLFFSATLPAAVVRLSGEMLTDAVRVRVETNETTRPRIDQQVMFVAREDKRAVLRMILSERDSFRALVFTRTKYRARDVARYLAKNGIASDDLHGDKSQNARTRALADFHSGRIQVLVATDIASRGIDIDDIDHVINFELPNETESYVHRIGRTARAGKAGIALSLCDATELGSLSSIQRALEQAIPVYSDHRYHNEEVASAASRMGRGRAGRQFEKPGQDRRSRSGGVPPKSRFSGRTAASVPRRSSGPRRPR